MNPTRYLKTLATAALLAAVTFVASPAAASPPTPASVDLAQVTRTLARTIDTTGTAWGVDERHHQVVVSYDGTVTGAALTRLISVTQRFGPAVRTERLPGTLRTYIAGGDGIFGGGSRCTLGFNVKNRSGADYFLTAGHCTNVSSSWYAADQTTFLGTRAGSSFPGNDYGIVRYGSGVTRTGNVNLHNGSYQDITGAGSPVVGEQLCISNPISGVRCGPLTGLNVTVNYPQGTVSGLGRIGICSMPGDSGAPVFQGSRAIGIVSGGSGNCSSGGVTYYQPITEVLNAYGVHVY